ncbi:MAG: hypothetical protein ACRC1M_02550, partial [Methanobacteriaceae archaeon]
MIFFSVLAMVNSSNAATNVTINNNTGGGIENAINSASDTVYLNSGVYSGNSNTDIKISKSIKIVGNGSKNSVIIDCKSISRAFTITETGNLTLINVVIQNGVSLGQTGSNNGGAILSSGSIYFINCSFINNNAKEYGGAINSEGILSIDGCNFINNSVYYGFARGGAIYCNFGSTSITNTNFTNNFAFAYTNDSYNGQVISQGGAVYGSNILIKNC